MTDKADKKSYKDTLNLPKTDFAMRAGLLKKEPVIQKKWLDENLYGQIRAERLGAPRFILHDGPPYANGNIHMGTSLNKILKDMVVRIKTMTGMDAPYLPGWDCHGLPIEARVMESLGPRAAGLDAVEIRKLCADYAKKFVAIQAEQFKRLGVIGEFDDAYLTMDPAYEAATLEVFARLVEQNLVYRQLKPVHWSIENRTALADAELEHHDRRDPSIYVAFELVEGAAKLPGCDGGRAALLIWTTTPWTLPANLAVAVHESFDYCCVRAETATGPMTLVIAEQRLETVMQALAEGDQYGLKSHKIVGKLTGRQLIEADLRYAHPIFENKTCPVVDALYVTLEDGTGLVHTAPGHGIEDYGTGLKKGLDIYCPVGPDGTFDETVPKWLVGMLVWDANDRIIEHLRRAKTLLLSETITHSYPHDWRSKKPTIFRATEQWFIGVDRPMAETDRTLRDLAMEACRRSADAGGIDFVPAWGRNRLAGMLESRPDWCISRQRSWGLPIPAFFDASARAIMTPASVRAVAETIAKHGSDAWFNLSPKQLLETWNYADDPNLPQWFAELSGDDPLGELTTGNDIFDVWFEAGSSWSAVALARNLVTDIPIDLYLEGSDQHRGWFQLSLLPALGAKGKPPFKTVLTHGYVVTEDGKKMSKSLGNTIDAVDQLEKRGADILRLWVAGQNYQDDIHCSEDLIAQTGDSYRKIRNTLRFCMGACFDFDPAVNAAEPSEHSVDRWMRMQLHELIRDVRAAYDRYQFHRATRLIYEFCTVQASSIYLSAAKDRLYCESPDALRRRASQTVIHEVLLALVKLLAPILPHTCDEAWDHIPNRPADEPQSIHLALLPDYDQNVLRLAEDIRPVSNDDATFEAKHLEGGPEQVWNFLLDLRQEGLVKLEALRNAGVKNPLDAEAVFEIATGDDETAKLIETYLKELEDLLGVGYARIQRTDSLEEGAPVRLTVCDSRQKYDRCARSWKRRPDVGSDAEYPDLCARDAAVMREISR